MKATYSLRYPRIDVEAYRRALDTHMREVLAQSLMAWLDAVLVEIPNWSGASRATFIQVANTINASVDASRNGAPYDRTSEGLANSRGEMTADKMKGIYTFTYGTSLPWLVWNEYHNANSDPDATKWKPPAKLLKPGPYGFQEKGAKAFQRVADTVRLPKVAPYVKSYPAKK